MKELWFVGVVPNLELERDKSCGLPECIEEECKCKRRTPRRKFDSPPRHVRLRKPAVPRAVHRLQSPDLRPTVTRVIGAAELRQAISCPHSTVVRDLRRGGLTLSLHAATWCRKQ